ncbi:MAG: sugar phosphate isomerase/epimerase [Daejeonella sp.]|uniref:sugar phosphate isomerase/epimerase family protein n=1 Tax=Daejeonella sp. TaxID=2805397 RepID=UPI002734EB0D|nr:sugar phosphate isomerase/epimerase [Daejeonella sp.]MDP3468926.1 sugar phosphate isomerase/epimerase [Daejeonella sp.]
MRQDRRKFIKKSVAGSAALLVSSLESYALPNMTTSSVNKNYDLKIMATSWGYQGTMDSFCAKVKKEGYDGIELWWPTDNKKAQDEIFAALKTYDLEIGFLCGGSQSNPQEHLEFYKRMVDAAAKQNIQRPLYINNHSGKDYFSFDDNKKFIEHTQELAKETGLLICHETHRGRMLFAAHITRNFLEKYPDLRLTLDISHWCNVHESLLADQKETIDLALARTDHIHARIGHPEGPQVNDPRAPEWEQTLKQHFDWWDKIVERKRRNGERVTVLTEFGPPDYMPTYPYTRQPLADQWAINVHMMHLLRKRYS